MSQLDQMRAKLLAKAKDAASSGRNPLEYTPDLGEVKVRLLPPIDPEDLFYTTHSYHYLPIDGGKYVYTKRKYMVNGVQKNDPIDDAVAQWYSLSKREQNEAIGKIAGTAKRKRHFFFNVILVDEPDPEKKFRILVDRSNDGKLAKKICKIMGIPFFRDVQDNWVDKNSLNIDEDADYFDLIDIENGHDLKIKKASNGSNTWDITYDDTVAVKKARPLTEEERELLEKRVDLKNYIEYEENYGTIKELLEQFVESIGAENGDVEVADEEEAEAETPKTEAKPKVPDVKKQVAKAGKKQSDEEIDEILSELDS